MQAKFAEAEIEHRRDRLGRDVTDGYPLIAHMAVMIIDRAEAAAGLGIGHSPKPIVGRCATMNLRTARSVSIRFAWTGWFQKRIASGWRSIDVELLRPRHGTGVGEDEGSRVSGAAWILPGRRFTTVVRTSRVFPYVAQF
jgi:hypothetical protein